jgi:FlaA1/EpsC-like NDP-sugar epimerase
VNTGVLVPAQENCGARLEMDSAARAVLGREMPPIYSDQAQLLIRGRTVLVTGAGGSIGSEIIRQLVRLEAGSIVCVDRDEYALYQLQLGLTGQALLTDENMVLSDVSRRPQLDAVFASFRPQIVFHAAACKHLPLLERAPAQAIATNVLGTMNSAALAVKYGAEHFVNVSTDKAARPTSILGMTKRVAEIVTAHSSNAVETKTASVRFGNVFASRGSFVETLAYQVAAGLPLTITDPDMTRFFMTIPQAASLVIEAAVMADSKSIFTLDMGESYNILSLARRYASICGLAEPEITCTGRRSGEKLEEELTGPGEVQYATAHPSITSIPIESGPSAHHLAIRSLVKAACGGVSNERLRATLTEVANASYLLEATA